MAAMNLPKIPAITPISSRITRILGANPSPYTLQGTNSYLIGRGKKRLLVDTSNPGKAEYIATLRKVLQEKDVVISNILITHWHEDHIGAVPEVQALCQSLAITPPVLHKFPGGPAPSWAREGASNFCALADNQVFRVDSDTTLRVLHTPGHTEDHVALWLEEEGVLFSADMILGHGTAVFESLFDYMESLQRVQSLSPPWSLILSAHGAEITTPDAVINTYMEHRRTRIAQVLDALSSERPTSDVELVDKVYPSLEESLKLGALNNTRHALSYLEKAGKARHVSGGGWQKVVQSSL